MKKPDTYMPLVIGDYLKDTMHLTAQEHGAYLLAIMHYWTTGPLPDDDKKLAAICRVDRSDWPGVRDTLAAFFQIADAQWRHKRIDLELQRAQRLKERAVEAGRASADARSTKSQLKGQLDGNLNPTKDPTNGQLKVNPATTTPTSTPESSELYLANNNTDSAREKIHALAAEIEMVVDAPPEFAFGLPSALEMLFREGHTELEIMDAARVIAAQGRSIKNPRYLVTTVRNRKADATRPSPRKPRYNPADATSPESVAERRAALARGHSAAFPAGGAGPGGPEGEAA